MHFFSALSLLLYFCAPYVAPLHLPSRLQTRASALSCPAADSTSYTTPSGIAYTIECGINHDGNDIGWSYTSSFEDCVASCSTTATCVSVSYVSSNGFCYRKNSVSTISNSPAVWSARLQTQSPAPAALSCPTSDLSLYTVSGVSYSIECGINHNGNDIDWSYAGSFENCLASCSTTASCVSVAYVSSSGFCYLKNSLGTVSLANSVVWSARLIAGLPAVSPVCPTAHGSVFAVSGRNVMVECYTDRSAQDIGPVPASDFNSCLRSCAADTACLAATFVPSTGWCWKKSSRGNPHAGNSGVLGLRTIDPGARLPNPTPYSASQWGGFAGITYIFAFGDSYVTNSFNTEGNQPSASNPIGNPGPPFHTTASGPNYLIILAEEYNISTVLLYDFGESGAILPDPTVIGQGPQLPHEGSQQIQQIWFENYVSTLAVPWTARNALFTFWFGINDAVDLIGFNVSQASLYLTADIAAYRTQLDFVYAQGGRNFLVNNVVPTDRTPGWGFRSADDRARLHDMIAQWNTALAVMLDGMRAAHPDAVVFLYDAWTTFDAVITDPKSRAGTAMLATTATWCDPYIGSTDPYACDPTCAFGCVAKYMWQDYIHPTWRVHEVVAAEIVALMV